MARQEEHLYSNVWKDDANQDNIDVGVEMMGKSLHQSFDSKYFGTMHDTCKPTGKSNDHFPL